MNSKERLKASLNHNEPDRVPVDFGGTGVTGIHVSVVENLRTLFGLEKKPVKVIEPFQMLGEIDEELIEAMGIDVLPLSGRNNMFGFPNENWKEFRTPWNQLVLVPGKFNVKKLNDGSLLMYPEGDLNADPSARMPVSGYFFDAIVRQKPFSDTGLNPEDNLQEYGLITDEDLAYWEKAIALLKQKGKGIIASFGGTALGDIALVPAMQLKEPRGIRDIAEWYMSTLVRPDYIHAVFEKQTDIALANYSRLYEIAGDTVDAVFLCGTDLGTQNSQFCSASEFMELYGPYYKKMTGWIHRNTGWKVFKHSCGAVEPLLNAFIEVGIDILNPVQINANGMDPQHLKKVYGEQLVFWGGGIDTQKILPFGTPEEVKKQVIENCSHFAGNGGFVFNSVHNIQAGTPVKNLEAMLEGLKEFAGK